LNCSSVQSEYDYGGLSGSPIVASNKICAITLVQQSNKLGCISIKKIEKFLKENGIEVNQPFDNIAIPDGLKREVMDSNPNFAVFDHIDTMLEENTGWILLNGSPGCGKTTISATYVPDNDIYYVVGRYFLKVPQDNLSATIRGSKRNFLEWIEELVYRTIGETLPAQKNWEEKEKDVPNLLNQLSCYFESIDKVGIIIIDGLDEIIIHGTSALFEFLGVIPFSLPASLRVIISCTSKDILPFQIKEIISSEQEIRVEPLDLAQCERYIHQKVNDIKLPYAFVQELARKSEGHPLYLNYLINYVLNEYSASDDEEQFQMWVQTIPVISGNIVNYYISIWDKINQNEITLAIISTLSQMRGSTKEEDLIQMLAEDYQLSFYTQIKSLLYLLNYSDKEYEIYHSSFKDFVISNISAHIIESINDKIVTFCEANENNNYSIWNYLYHLSKCSFKIRCIEQCTQKWADRCASMNVDPELVLIDIKNSTSIAIDAEQTTEVIRLLLLSQRIEFRYDSVFAENAFELAEAMIALGKPNAAFKYLVRGNTILTTESDSIYFLQLFYENGYSDFAHILYENICAKSRENYNADSFSTQTFLTQLYAQTLLCNEGKLGLERFKHLMKSLYEFEQSLNNKDDNELYQSIRMIREYGVADNNAFVLRRYNQYRPIEQLIHLSTHPVDKIHFKTLALSLLKYDELNNAFNYIGKNESHIQAVDDLISCLQKYKFEYTLEELDIILLSIVPDCRVSKVVIDLIKQYNIPFNKLKLREENGVDVDFKELLHNFNQHMFRGYVDEDNLYPSVSGIMYRQKQWENYLVSIIENIAFIQGKLYRYRADGNTEIGSIYNRLQEILIIIDFSFDERSHWDRSYYIPENVFPYIYSQISHIYIDFFQNKITDFISILKRRAENQLCLYTEGFRRSLFDIIDLLAKNMDFRGETSELLNILEQHILTGVQNRWERTPELIRLVKYYGLIDNRDKALDVFQKMLDTSMGPSWYKEDQLQLINRIVRIGENQKHEQYYRNYASLFDLASGEMTFQRYVRYEKEKFIGSLVKQGQLCSAIEYFKFETLPSSSRVIQNAESNPIDMPRKGDGYILGAKNIVEANGILELLEIEKNASPFTRWALSEIFLINDDNFRYISSFAEVHAKLLNEIEKTEPKKIDAILERLANHLTTKKLEESDRVSYLKHIQDNTSESIVKKIQGYLLKQNFSWNIQHSKDETQNKYLETRDVFDDACEFYEKNSTNTTRDTVLKKLMVPFEQSRIGIWFVNYSRKHSLLKEYLKKYFKTDKEALKVLKSVSLNSSFEKWVIVSQILWFIENNINDNQIEHLHSIVSEHFSLLIRPEENSSKKYEWLELNRDAYPSDQKIIELIIWLLNHPSFSIREKADDVLLWLSRMNQEFVIKSLINESTSDSITPNVPVISLTNVPVISLTNVPDVSLINRPH